MKEKKPLLQNLYLLFLGDFSHASPLLSLIKCSSVFQIHSQIVNIQPKLDFKQCIVTFK